MTAVTSTIPYAGPTLGTCPLCRQRPNWKKPLYGHPVCKKCYYGFANRRQIAYIVDSLLFAAVVFGVVMLLPEGLVDFESREVSDLVVAGLISLAFGCLFVMKDGFSGHSPGKRLAGVQVLDERGGRPISFGQSFKRNAILLLGHIPVVGRLAGLAVVVTIAIQMNKGYRTGDNFAKTRVIWKKFARSPVFGGDGLLCESCGYELTGNQSGVCPECGTAVAGQQRDRLATGVARVARG